MEQGEHAFFLAGVQTLAATMEINMAVSQKTGNQFMSRHNYITPKHIPKECLTVPQGYLLNYVHIYFIFNRQNL